MTEPRATRQPCATEPPGAPRPSVSIVVPVHRGGQAFRRCLRSLKALDPQPRELVAVADGRGDGSAEVAERMGLRVVRLGRRGGPARARNAGVRETSADVVLFVDADVELRADSVARVAGAFGQDPGVAAVFGSYDDLPAEPNFLSQWKNLQHHWIHQKGREEASTFWAGCGAVRREVFEALGGFDESFRSPSVEDIELGYRIRAAGHRIRLLKDLRCKHLKRWGATSLLRAEVLHRALPWTGLILERRGFTDDLNTTVSGRVCVALSWVLALASAGAVFAPRLGALALCAGAGLLLLNADFYRFLYRKRGGRFLAGAIPWHVLYFLYSGAGFAAGLARHWLGRRRRSPDSLSRGLTRAG